MAKLKVSTMWLPRPAVKYHGCYPMWFENRLPEILETTNYVHFFAGMSKTGYRIDVNPSVNPDLVADVECTGLPSESFEAGMADPPYTPEFAEKLYNTPYPKWTKWTKELVRLVKPGGRIGIMQNYIVPQLAGCQMEEIIVILLRIKQYPKIVTVQRKL
jgi:hypothetical protein